MTDDPETALMRSIGVKFGLAIAETCKTSSVPESFLAALIANESGGNPNARRFEIGHFGEILAVMAGQKAQFSPPGISRSLGVIDFQPYLDPDPQAGVILRLPQYLARAVQLATSFGLTQIMGWHFVEFDTTNMLPLPAVPQQLRMTITILAYFANRYQLDFQKDWQDLFACWNCGLPDPSKTFDPKYCANGLARMVLYEKLRAFETAQTPAPAGN